MPTKRVYTVVAALLAVLLLPSCAVTTAPTEASSQTSGNTSDATSDLTSSTSLRDEEDEETETDPNAAAESFVRSNSTQLRADMAVGGGEYLNTFAILLNINGAKKEQFFAVTKTNFDQIFDSSNASAKKIVANTRKVTGSAGI